MLERPSPRLAPLSVFFRRLGLSIVISALLMFVSLGIGVCGYHWIVGMDWIDALLNASMILGGMGPVEVEGLEWKVPGKLFASGYALFCGLVMVGAMGVVLAPILHRMLHKFHLDESDYSEQDGG